MTWQESEYPRDEDGKFTFKNGGGSSNGSNVLESAAHILYGKVIKNEQDNRVKSSIENKLLDILGNKATHLDVLYGNKESLMKKIKKQGLEGKLTGGAVSTKQNFTKPLNGIIRSEFGLRKQPVPGASKYHKGIDISVPIGTPVKTIYPGKVTKAGASDGYGIAVYIDHGIINGHHITSEYGHLSKVNVKAGDKINIGQVVAKSGNTGYSNGPHLHLTIKIDGKAVNPRNYINF